MLNEEKIYKNSVGVTIEIANQNVDLSTEVIENLRLEVLTPSRDIVAWGPIQVDMQNNIMRYVTKEGDLTVAGTYFINAWIELQSGYKGYSDTIELQVSSRFT